MSLSNRKTAHWDFLDAHAMQMSIQHIFFFRSLGKRGIQIFSEQCHKFEDKNLPWRKKFSTYSSVVIYRQLNSCSCLAVFNAFIWLPWVKALIKLYSRYCNNSIAPYLHRGILENRLNIKNKSHGNIYIMKLGWGVQPHKEPSHELYCNYREGHKAPRNQRKAAQRFLTEKGPCCLHP